MLATCAFGGATASGLHFAQETLSAKTTHDDVDYYHVSGSASHPLAVATTFDLAILGGENVYLRYDFDNLVLRDGATPTPPAITLADGTPYTAAQVSTFITERDVAVFAFAAPAGTTLAADWEATLELDDALAVRPGDAAGAVVVRLYLDALDARRGTERHLLQAEQTLVQLVEALEVRIEPRPPAIASVAKDYLSFTTGDSAVLADVSVQVAAAVAAGTADEAPVLNAATGAQLVAADVLGTVTVDFLGDFSIGTFSLVAKDAACPPRYDGLTLYDDDGHVLGAADDPADAVKATGTITAAEVRSFCINVAGNTVPITPRSFSANIEVVLALGLDAPFTPTFPAAMPVSPVRSSARPPPPVIPPGSLPPTVQHGAGDARYFAVETLRPTLLLSSQYYGVTTTDDLLVRTTFKTPITDNGRAYLYYELRNIAFTRPGRPPKVTIAPAGADAGQPGNAVSSPPEKYVITRRIAGYAFAGTLAEGWTATLDLTGAVAVRPGDGEVSVNLFLDERPHYTGIGFYVERHARTLVRTVQALVATVTPRLPAVAAVADWFASFADGDSAVLADVTVAVRDAIEVGPDGATKPILDAADGKRVRPSDVLGHVTVDFHGDFSKGAFSLVPAGQPCPAESTGLRLRTEEGRTVRAAEDPALAASARGTLRAPGESVFCVNMAANDRPVPTGAYTATLTASLANRSAPPLAPLAADRPSGAIDRDGATVFLPVLNAHADYRQRLVIVNRARRPAPYKLDDFAPPPGGAATPGPAAAGVVPPESYLALPVADLVTVVGASRAAATLMLDASPGRIDVLTTTTGPAGSTDTVVHEAQP